MQLVIVALGTDVSLDVEASHTIDIVKEKLSARLSCSTTGMVLELGKTVLEDADAGGNAMDKMVSPCPLCHPAYGCALTAAFVGRV